DTGILRASVEKLVPRFLEERPYSPRRIPGAGGDGISKQHRGYSSAVRCRGVLPASTKRRSGRFIGVVFSGTTNASARIILGLFQPISQCSNFSLIVN